MVRTKKNYRIYPVGSTFIDETNKESGRVLAIKKGKMEISWIYEDNESIIDTWTPRQVFLRKTWVWTVPKPLIFISDED